MPRLFCAICLCLPLMGCIGTAVGVATDVVVGAVDITTDVVGTAVDIVTPDFSDDDD